MASVPVRRVFKGVGEAIHKTSSGADLISVARKERALAGVLAGAQVPGRLERDGEDADDDDAARRGRRAFLASVQAALPDGWSAKGNLFVFVDEAHRTQSGKLHRAMKALLPDAMFIGFTGTPLLKTEKRTSLTTFGSFIHTYKFDEAVADGVVLDLRYEARDIEQALSSPAKVDTWFDAKTRGLNDVAKAALKRRWGTLQALYSAEARTKKIVADVELDMETRPRLMDERGNALLVTASIYQACKFYEEFTKGPLKGKVRHRLQLRAERHADLQGGRRRRADRTADAVRDLSADAGRPLRRARRRGGRQGRAVRGVRSSSSSSIEPDKMRLLIVVDKLLTGFDAPSATYLYLDKKMRDHGLFQAICRVNRLDGDDKDYGYIVDYRDLFKSLREAVDDYTGEALDGYDAEDVAGCSPTAWTKGARIWRRRWKRFACSVEPVAPPRTPPPTWRYFCGDVDDPEALQITEPKRAELYKTVAVLVRRYAALANDMAEAGYSDEEAADIKREVDEYSAAAMEVKVGSGDFIDLKRYEPDMRRLLDTYVSAEDSRRSARSATTTKASSSSSSASARQRPTSSSRQSGSESAAAATIINNVRRLIIDEGQTNPKYYDKMSELLNALIEQQKQDAKAYDEYLRDLAKLAAEVEARRIRRHRLPRMGRHPRASRPHGLRSARGRGDCQARRRGGPKQ